MTIEQEKHETAVYVYGIVPADIEVEPDVRGVGDPPDRVRMIRHGRIAALVSSVAADHTLGSPEDLGAHAWLLDSAAAQAPVLPLRFGAVVTDERAVEEELLGRNHDSFKAALDELEGHAEFVVKGRYVHEAILREVLAENAEAQQLRQLISDKPADATRPDRIALGELVQNAVGAKRDIDTARVADALAGLGPVARVTVRPPTHEEDAAHVACLAETVGQAEIEQVVDELAGQWDGRVTLRVLGPLAAYDFVDPESGQE
jgi:hypothetical protein